MTDSLKNKTFRGVIWSSVERFSVQGIQFLVMLIIARILDPKDFGLIGMLLIFLAIAQSLIDSGFSQALIRKLDRTEIDNCTVFYFNITISLLLYVIFYLVAPLVADFYKEPQLTSLMRLLCVVIIINSTAVIQRTIYTANLDFKTQARATFIAALISGLIGIALAYYGYGVWALVWQSLINTLVGTVLLWGYSNWYPKLLFSWQSFKFLFSFGSKLLASGLLDTLYTNLYPLIIGKIFNSSNLGFYTQADRITRLTAPNLTSVIQRVTYPVLSSMQNEDERLREDYRKLLKLSAFLIFPMMCLIAGLSYPLVRVLLGERWEYTATLLIPLSFTMMWWPIHAINLNLLQVKGRSDLFLKLEIIKKTIGVTILILSIPFGLLFMCYAGIFTSILCLIINTYYTGKLIQVGFLIQMNDLSSILMVSFVVFSITYGATLFTENTYAQLFLAVGLGFISFCFIVYFFNFKELEYLKSIIRK